ncbi:MAG: hypothetical protein ACKOYJ_01705 [Planctomycetia bacterium]
MCEVPFAASERFEALMGGVPWAWSGAVLSESMLEIVDTSGTVSRLAVDRLARAWRRID